jgi:hypothetical protein
MDRLCCQLRCDNNLYDLTAYQMKKVTDKKTPPKKIKDLSLWQQIKAHARIAFFFKRKTFTGTYWENKQAMVAFVQDKNVLLQGYSLGNDRLVKFDFRMEGTQAAKKTRIVTLIYVKDHWSLTLLGFFLHLCFCWLGFVAVSNWFSKFMGFKDNFLARRSLGL